MAASLLSARPVASRPARRARTAAPCRAQLLNEVAQLASDSRPLILLGLGAPVLGYVAYQARAGVARRAPGPRGRAASPSRAPRLTRRRRSGSPRCGRRGGGRLSARAAAPSLSPDPRALLPPLRPRSRCLPPVSR